MKRKRQKPKAGDVFAIPLLDDTFGLGHLVVYRGLSATCALFYKRAGSPGELLDDLDAALAQPLTIINITSQELRSGEWPIIAFREPRYPPAWIPKYMCEGAVSYTATAAPALLHGCHGLTPWDELFDPRGYEKMLLPGVPVPPTVRYKRDFPQQSLASPSSTPAAPPPVTDGPAEIHIQIVYPGDGFPAIELLRKRQDLERRLEAEGAGEVTDAGAGGGVMDVFLATDDVKRAVPIVEKHVAELGLAEDTLIETSPIGGEDDD